MSASGPYSGVSLAKQQYHHDQQDGAPGEHRAAPNYSMSRAMFPLDDGLSRLNGADGSNARFRPQGHLERTSSPLSRGAMYNPSAFVEASRGGHQSNSASSPPAAKGSIAGSDRGFEPRGSTYPKGPLDFAPSSSPASTANDRPKSSLSDRSLVGRDGAGQQTTGRPVLTNGGGPKEPEFSIFIGDLSPDLREEDLVTQFLQPPPWPPQHPFAIAHAHAQRMQGIYPQPGARIGPAPFLSTKSAKIMTDPVTGTSRGYGFVRFTKEGDCNRALIEMQGVVIAPANGLSPGRPLRVSTATPKSRSSPNSVGAANSSTHNNDVQQQQQAPAQQQQHPHSQAPSHAHHQPHPLQMPKPHHAAADESAAYLLQQGLLGGRNLVSPQPRSHPPPSMMQFASPMTPSSPFDSGLNGQQSMSTFQAAYPPSAGPAGVEHLERTVSPPSARAYTPASAGPAAVSGPPKPSAMDPNNTTVFVGGLSSLISEDTLRQFFEPYGEITYVKIPPGKGCGFVQFVHKADAERAINLMNGFPVGNARIRLSWGRSQGDKAAAAAAQAVQQASQLGHLAGLAGLSALTPSQLAQLAGLGSALSAAQASAARAASGQPHNGADHLAFSNDPLSTLARQLAAANAGAATSGASAVYRNAQMSRPPPPPPASAMHHHQPPPHHQQLHSSLPPQHHSQHQQIQQQHNHHQHPHQPHQHQQPQQQIPPFYPHQQPGHDGPDGFRHHQHAQSHAQQQQELDALSSLSPSTLQQLLAASAAPGMQDYGLPRSLPHQQHSSHVPYGAGANGGPNDLAQAFANLGFDEGVRGGGAYPARGPPHHNESSSHGRGYTRDPSAFLFSPFSPADSPVVGGKTDLPNDSSDDPLHLPERANSRDERSEQ